jgi:leucyl-tRNA synthetase
MKVPDAVEKICSRLEELGVGKKTKEYRLRDWLVSR